MSDFPEIQKDPVAFIKAIQDGKNVCGNKDGQWYVEGSLKSVERRLRGTDCNRLAKIGIAFNACLDQLESLPVTFNTSNQKLQTKKIELFLNSAAIIKDLLDLNKDKSEKIQEQLDRLNNRIVGLNYRREEANGGLNKIAKGSVRDINFVEGLAINWKKGNELYNIKKLTPTEKIKLAEACLYPEFIVQLRKDEKLQNDFLSWVMIQNNEPDFFIQYPGKANMLSYHRASNRTGRFEGQNCLAIEQKQKNSGGTKKIVTLPFQVQEDNGLAVKRINILKDNKKVILRGNYEQTIKEIFQQIKQKKSKPSNIEFLNGVVCNFHTFKFGWWNPDKVLDGVVTPGYESVDFSQENAEWWKDLPVFEKISKEICMARYGIDKMEDGAWAVVATSARESASLDVLKTHGYDIYAIPDEDGKNYNIYPIGRFATKWPLGMIEEFLFLANTVPASYSYDENEFYPYRQKAFAPYVVTSKIGIEIMESKRKNIVKSMQGNSVFQFSDENCAKETQVELEKHLGKQNEGGLVPNMFRTHILNTEARIFPMNVIFKFTGELPQKLKKITKGFNKQIRCFVKDLGLDLQKIIIRIVEFVTFSWRGQIVIENGQEVWRSTACSSFRETNNVFLPALLHSKIYQGLIPGRLSIGQHVVQV